MKTKLFILFLFTLALSLSAQVGVNNNDPEQALDVNGKVKITDDDTDPTAGTMRYNDSDKQFEGYDGAQWNSFNTKKSGALPSNSIPVFGWSGFVIKDTRKFFQFSRWEGGGNFRTPNPGKLLIITGIYPRPNGLSKNSDFQFSIGVSSSETGAPETRSVLLFFSETNVTQPITGDAAPLFVIRPGQYLTVFNESSSSININMNVRGFLVDNLNY